MACGAPLITNPESPLAQEISDGVNALLAPLNEPGVLVEVMLRLLRDPALGQRLGRAGRQLMAEQFNLNTALELYEGLFQRLSSASSRAGNRPIQSPWRG